MTLKDYDNRGRKYCKNCKKLVITKQGVDGKLWCKICNTKIK